MKNPETQDQRIALLEEWSKRLGLNSWTITATLNCVDGDMQNEHVVGETLYNTSIKNGDIKIVAKKFFNDEDDYDFEQTLVHELLHLKFGILWDNSDGVAKSLMHQIIEELAVSMVDAKRCSQS